MKLMSRKTARQPLALVNDGLEALPLSAPDIDVSGLASTVTDTVNDLATTIASGGTRTAVRSARTLYRRRRAVGYGALAVMLVVLGAVAAKKLASSDEPTTANR